MVDGIQVVLNTPFQDDGSIDYQSLQKEIDHVLGRGANGVVIAMVSEVLRLSDDERKELASFVVRGVAGRGTTTISVGSESSHCACDFARHAESVGADALMAIPPLSVAAGDVELTAYYESILSASSLPLIVQDASGYVGRPMSIALQAGLMQRYGEHRVMFKPEAEPIGQRLSELRDATQGRARVFEGSGGSMLLDSYRRGICGTMPGAEMIDGIVALWKALEAGPTEARRAENLADRITALVSIGLQGGLDGYIATEKCLLVDQGIFPNENARGPVGYSLDSETRNEIRSRYQRLMAIV